MEFTFVSLCIVCVLACADAVIRSKAVRHAFDSPSERTETGYESPASCEEFQETTIREDIYKTELERADVDDFNEAIEDKCYG